MIAKAELSTWLAETPSRPVAAANFTHHWRAQPALARLHAELDALLVPDADAIAALVAALFAEGAWIDRWIADMATAARADPFFAPPLAPLSNGFQVGLQIFVHRLVRMSIGVLPIDALSQKKTAVSGPRAITFSGTLAVQHFVRSGDCVLQMWHAPVAAPDFTAAQAGRCNVGIRRPLVDGTTLVLDGRCESYVIEQARGDIVILQAEVLVGEAPLLVEYDANECHAVAVSSTDDGASRSQMMLSFLGRLNRAGDADLLSQFTRDRMFFIRWHAMSELLAMDPPRALPDLHRMARDDDHAELRAAAASVLAALAAPEREAVPCHA